MVTVIDEDREKARQLAKKEVALFLPVVAENDKTLQVDEELLNRIEAAAAEYDFERGAKDISDELLSRFAIVGTPADIIKQTQALLDAGASRIEYGTPHGIDELKGMKMLGENVLPAFA